MRPNYSSSAMQQQFQELTQCQHCCRCHVTSVPTTFHDDQQHEVANSRVVTKFKDPFLHYSNDKVRMRRLLSHKKKTSSANNKQGRLQDTTTVGRKVDDQIHVIKRKTRLSFELHPSVFFDDSFHSKEDLFSNHDNNGVPKKAAAATAARLLLLLRILSYHHWLIF